MQRSKKIYLTQNLLGLVCGKKCSEPSRPIMTYSEHIRGGCGTNN